jgi:hypothetical protein
MPRWTQVSPNPFATRAWAAAWERVHTEPVLGSVCVGIDGPDGYLAVPLYLVERSPLWTAYEAHAGVPPVWPGSVVYGPSPYAVYGGFGAIGPVAGEIVTQGLAYARDSGASAVVFPGLTRERVAAWLAVAPQGIPVRTIDSHQAPARGPLEAFQAAIADPKARGEFGREWRRGSGSGLALALLRGTEIEPYLGRFTRLAATAAARHGVPHMYGEDVFRAVMTVPGTVLLAALHQDELVGGFLCLLHDGTLYLWAAGLDYARLRELHTYGWLMVESIRAAADAGATMIDAGRGNHRYKQRVGFEQIPLWALAYLTHPDAELEDRLTELGAALKHNNEHGERATPRDRDTESMS